MIAIGGLFFIWQIRAELSVIKINHDGFQKHLNELDIDFKELTKITATVANQNARLDSYELRIANIKEQITQNNNNEKRFEEGQNKIQITLATISEKIGQIETIQKDRINYMSNVEDKLNSLTSRLDAHMKEDRSNDRRKVGSNR